MMPNEALAFKTVISTDQAGRSRFASHTARERIEVRAFAFLQETV